MDHRRPSAGNDQAIGIDVPGVALQQTRSEVVRPDFDAGQGLALGADDCMAGKMLPANRCSNGTNLFRDFGAQIDHGGNESTGVAQRLGGGIGAVIIGEQHDLVAGQDTELVDIALRR